jgi:hypothetical protein
MFLAGSFVLIANSVFGQYLTWDTKKERDTPVCPYQLAIAQKKIHRVEKEIKALSDRLSGKTFYCVQCSVL